MGSGGGKALTSIKVTGGKPLWGKVHISGAKNAILPLVAASLLAEGETRLENVPRISDVQAMLEIAGELGVRVWWRQDEVSLHVPARLEGNPSYALARRLRASNLFLGALLARRGEAEIPLPGGCDIGTRPMDLHLKGLQALGAEVEVRGGSIRARGRLAGAEVYLDFPSVGATENIMLAATRAAGQTVIANAAREPEIVDLASFLNSMGAHVRGAGTGLIKIDGVDELHPSAYMVIPDRIEAGTFMLAAALTEGELFLRPIIPLHLQPVIAKLREMGVTVKEGDGGLRVAGRRPYRAVNVKTMPYPGFPTDLQSMMLALLSLSEGTSLVVETVYENRLQVAGELRRMGAHIEVEGQTAVVVGVERLLGSQVRAPDLRAGAALVLAGLAAEGVTEVFEPEHIFRGYQDLPGKLAAVGAMVRVEE